MKYDVHYIEQHEKQIVSDCMFKHDDHYLKFCIPECSFVLTIQKVVFVSLTFYMYTCSTVGTLW